VIISSIARMFGFPPGDGGEGSESGGESRRTVPFPCDDNKVVAHSQVALPSQQMKSNNTFAWSGP
jgi:hypothetical protein